MWIFEALDKSKELENLQKNRKELILQAKQNAEQLLNEVNAKIENTIRTIKEAQAEKELTKEVREELKSYKETILKNNYDKCVRIPMHEKARSLNLSNSVAIATYEVLRQWDYPQLQNFGQLHNYRWEDI